MNTTDKIINDLGMQFADKTIECANYKAFYEEAREQLQEAHKQLEKINKVLQSNEELKALFDKVAEELDKPKEEG